MTITPIVAILIVLVVLGIVALALMDALEDVDWSNPG